MLKLPTWIPVAFLVQRAHPFNVLLDGLLTQVLHWYYVLARHAMVQLIVWFVARGFRLVRPLAQRLR